MPFPNIHVQAFRNDFGDIEAIECLLSEQKKYCHVHGAAKYFYKFIHTAKNSWRYVYNETILRPAMIGDTTIIQV
jgi:hypothetical protein